MLEEWNLCSYELYRFIQRKSPILYVKNKRRVNPRVNDQLCCIWWGYFWCLTDFYVNWRRSWAQETSMDSSLLSFKRWLICGSEWNCIWTKFFQNTSLILRSESMCLKRYLKQMGPTSVNRTSSPCSQYNWKPCYICCWEVLVARWTYCFGEFLNDIRR
jgi:hypothetical protein